jgi:hypothetical protein
MLGSAQRAGLRRRVCIPDLSSEPQKSLTPDFKEKRGIPRRGSLEISVTVMPTRLEGALDAGIGANVLQLDQR